MTPDRLRTSLAAASFVLLAACGGGGDNSSSNGSTGSTGGTLQPADTTLTGITGDNYVSVAADAYAAATSVTGALETPDASPFIPTLPASTTSTAMTTTTTIKGTVAQSGIVNNTLDLASRALAAHTAQVTAGTASSPQMFNCSVSGYVLVDATMRDTSAKTLSSGDTLKVTGVGCIDNGLLINGAMAMTFRYVNGLPGANTTWSATLATVFTDFSADELTSAARVRATGDMTIGLTQTIGATAVTQQKMALTSNALRTDLYRDGTLQASRTLGTLSATYAWQGTTLAAGVSFTHSGTSTKLGTFKYGVKTTVDFVSATGAYPAQGEMVVTGANAATVTLTALDSQRVRVTYRKDGTAATGTIDTTWTALTGAAS